MIAAIDTNVVLDVHGSEQLQAVIAEERA